MNHKLQIRRAATTDFAAVLNLAGELAEHIKSQKPALTAERYEHYYLHPGAPMHLLLAVESGQVQGLISWTVTHELYSADTRLYISDLVVSTSARGKGIGRALMNEAVVWARAHNVEKLGWDVWRFNQQARDFYEKLGGRVDNEALPYVLNLEQAAQ
ncbi:MAG: GNAT family N-acetyltransferase [Paludibaculum sp.]